MPPQTVGGSGVIFPHTFHVESVRILSGICIKGVGFRAVVISA